MTYTKGEAYIGDDYSDRPIRLAIMLPHSCDEWVIGTPEDAQNLINDLVVLIEELKGKQEVK